MCTFTPVFVLQGPSQNIPPLMAVNGRCACLCINKGAVNLALIAEEAKQVITFESLIVANNRKKNINYRQPVNYGIGKGIKIPCTSESEGFIAMTCKHVWDLICYSRMQFRHQTDAKTDTPQHHSLNVLGWFLIPIS